MSVQRYDSIIIGAGHNGLVCAAYLARSGQRVRVLEASGSPGGLAAEREFHPGFRVPVAHSIGHLAERVVNDLDLRARGFSVSDPLATIALAPGGTAVAVSGDTVDGVQAADRSAYTEYRRLMQAFAAALEPFWLKTMPRVGAGGLGNLFTWAQLGLNLRRLGRDDMREFLRIAALPVRDLMDEFFDNDRLKTALGWDGLIGSKMAPRSPNGPVLTMLYRLGGAHGGAHVIPATGSGGLASSLAAAASAAGAEISCDSPVGRILVDGSADGQAVRGVQLESGETIEADRVVSGVDPQRTFVDLVGVKYLDIGFTNRIRRLRCDGYVAKLHLALDGLPSFTGIDRPDARMILAEDLDAIEFAFDAAKYGDCPDRPVMEVVVPSLYETALAPEGRHVLSAQVLYVPYALKGGWTAAARDRMRDQAIDRLERFAPGIRGQIVAAEFLTPADLEREYRVTGGHWHHTEFAMDQMLMMRPTWEAAQYATPIPGLYLCGAGSHPAGDLTGAAGYNAAQEILG